MDEVFKLKPINRDSIDESLRKAERYRLLNEPAQAESICRDILRVAPDHQPTLVTIILALSDQLSHAQSPHARVAREYAAKLTDPYQQCYYRGIICERKARAMMTRGNAAAFAYDGFREAMELYEQAQKLQPGGNDAILRWNSCVRTIRKFNLRPRAEERELFLE